MTAYCSTIHVFVVWCLTGTYNIQSSVLLMGSGADELFGGYGRHRTAGITRGLEALRKEQIL